MREILKNGFKSFNIDITDYQLDQFEEYYRFLASENEKMNLTAITEEEDVAYKHFLDCASLFTVCDIKEGAAVCDVGTGAGFPGVVLKIVRPDLKMVLIDSLNKRVEFLKRLCEKLQLENVECLHFRAEDAASLNEYREQFDVCASRAVARLNTLCEYCLGFVKVGGMFCALKGPDAKEELSEAQNALSILGASKGVIKSAEISGADFERNIVLVDKVRHIPEKYPRKGAKPTKQPLK